MPDKQLYIPGRPTPEEEFEDKVKQALSVLFAKQNEVIDILNYHKDALETLGRGYMQLSEKYETLRKDHRRLAKYVNGGGTIEGNDADESERYPADSEEDGGRRGRVVTGGTDQSGPAEPLRGDDGEVEQEPVEVLDTEVAGDERLAGSEEDRATTSDSVQVEERPDVS